METLEITIEGMSCGHCLAAVRTALEGQEGVTVERVALGEAVVHFDPSRTTAAQITDAVSDVGYLAYRAAPRAAR